MDKSLKEFRKNNEDNLDKSQEYFEKQLTFISAGTFGISMFFRRCWCSSPTTLNHHQ